MLREVAEVYLGAEKELLTAFRGSHAEGDADGVARAAHRLRGSAGAFEAVHLCAILGRIEKSALANDGPGIDAAFPEFERAMQGLHDELEQAVRGAAT